MSEARSRGRPRTFDRDAVLDATVDEFLLHGYEGVSISDLTEVLGCTAPTLYALFGSKEGLFRHALDRYVDRGFGAVADLLVGHDSLYARVEAWLRATAAAVTSADHPRGCLVLTGSLAAGPSATDAATAVAHARAAALGILRRHFAEGRDNGVLPPHTDVDGLARFYLAVAQGMSVQAIDGATRDQLEPLIEVALAAWPGQSPG